jgi:hypothetical protein
VRKPAPTLIDILYRASFRNETIPGWTNNALWRDHIKRARKFVLDDAMSGFLGELGTAAFVGKTKRSAAVRFRMVEHLRMSARLPAEVTWIEYNLRACQKRSNELLGRDFDLDQMPGREGWLLVRHPKIETAFLGHIVSHDPDIDHGDGFDMWTFPVALGWTADTDTVLPWPHLPSEEGKRFASEYSTGITGYKTRQANYVKSPLIETPNNPGAISSLISEWAGVQRRMWALLATINDLPVQMTEVRAARGFVAKGSYRRFLDHKTVTLTVPVKTYRKVIRSALAAVHRRGGPVREHWRKDFRRPLSVLCEHEWGADEKHMFCVHCNGRKIWINEHVRGDTSRGFVTHDFVVTHKP